MKTVQWGVNFSDVLLIQGLYQVRPETPFVPGGEFAGVVTETGEGVKGFKVSDRIACFTPNCGAYSEQVFIYVNRAIPIHPRCYAV